MSTRPPNPDPKCLTPQGLPPPMGVEPATAASTNASATAAASHISVDAPPAGFLDPAEMSPHDRMAEFAGLLAAGFRRMRRRQRGLAPAAEHHNPPSDRLELPSPARPDGSPVVDAGRGEVP